MPKIYHSAVLDDEVAIDNCQELTKHTFKDFVGMTGVYGVHKVEDVIKMAHILIHKPAHFFKIKIVTSLVTVIVRLDFYNKEVTLIYMEVNDPAKGIGLSLFLDMLRNLRKAGFKRIRCTADGDFDKLRRENINGYIVWALFGFTITSPSTQFYKSLAIDTQLDPFMSLNHLVYEMKVTYTSPSDGKTYTAHGVNFWKMYGFAWEAQFNINRNSKNARFLQRHIDAKQTPNYRRLRIALTRVWASK